MRRTPTLVSVLLLASCTSGQHGSSFRPPARDQHILVVERRVAPLIEQSQRGSNAPGQCTVRVLGEKGDTKWVWASCRWLPSNGVGGPFRIDGDKVTATSEGSEYEGSVRQLFPYEMAQTILNDPERLQPEEAPIG